MKLTIVTPHGPSSATGNFTTARRISWLLKDTAVKCKVVEQWNGEACDTLLAIHAEKSGRSIDSFASQCPGQPIIVLLAGTDIYQRKLSRRCLKSLDLADRLVALQPLAAQQLPARLRRKTLTIYQAARAPEKPAPPMASAFEVCVVSNLRYVKDPLRTALAIRDIPSELRVFVTHIGRALDEALAERARKEMANNRRYRWFGQRPPHQALKLIERSRLFVNSSRSEGGANVISEAIACGTPILASRVAGNIGLLGDDYPGLFRCGSTSELREMILFAQAEPHWLKLLQQRLVELQPAFTPEAEREAWLELLEELDT